MNTVTAEQATRLLTWIETVHKLKSKTNDELAQLLIDHIWSDIPIGTPQSDLLSEVIDRLSDTDRYRAAER